MEIVSTRVNVNVSKLYLTYYDDLDGKVASTGTPKLLIKVMILLYKNLEDFTS